MKSKDIKQLETKSEVELQKLIKEMQRDLVDLRMKKSIGKLKNLRQIKMLRHDLAIINTVLSKKQLNR